MNPHIRERWLAIWVLVPLVGMAVASRAGEPAIPIEAGYEEKGLGTKAAGARAWATVNKLTGGGKKSGSGRKNKGS